MSQDDFSETDTDDDTTPGPAVNAVRWGDFDRTRPFCSLWGTARGRPVDRYYIERFLGMHAGDVQGRCLEVENANYLRKYAEGQVESMDVLDIDPANPNATLIADLATGEGIPENAFDCLVMTQTLQFIFDAGAAVANARRLLKPGGVMLATVPGITPQPRRDPYTAASCWSFTSTSVERLFGDAFGAAQVDVSTFGNVYTATAFLWGMGLEELSPDRYEVTDPDYPVIIAARAVRA